MPTDNAATNKSSRNATVISLIVCCGFVVCWTPSQIIHFLGFVGYTIDRNTFVRPLARVLLYTNSCINPFIYAAKYGEFQNGVRRMVARLTGKPLQNNESGQVASIRVQSRPGAVT